MMTVQEAFNIRFPLTPRTIRGGEMEVASICGQDCLKAIQAGADFADHTLMAYGNANTVADQTQKVCEIYING